MHEVSANASDRRGHIGGSDAAAILGVSKRKTAFQVWLQITGQAGADEDNEAMWWGRALEPIILKRYAEDNGVKVRPGRVVCDQKRGWRVGHIDGDVETPSLVVDSKSVGIVGYEGKYWGHAGTDQCPPDVLCQMHHYLSLNPAWECAHVPALIAGKGLQTFVVLRNDEFEAYLVEREEKFWRDHVEKNMPPELDASEECAQWLARIHPFPKTQALLESTPALDEIAIAYRTARRRRLLDKEEEDLHANRIRSLIGDDRGIKGPWGAIILGSNGKGGRKLTPKFNDEENDNG